MFIHNNKQLLLKIVSEIVSCLFQTLQYQILFANKSQLILIINPIQLFFCRSPYLFTPFAIIFIYWLYVITTIAPILNDSCCTITPIA